MKEPFNKFLHLINFTDSSSKECALLECNWTTEHLKSLLQSWRSRPQCDEKLDESHSHQRLSELIQLVLIFVQNNFTGPFTQLSEFSLLLTDLALPDCSPFIHLMENGEEVNSNVQLGELLIVAKNMLQQLLKQWPNSLVLRWWQLRIVCIHQHIIDELTSNLYEQFKEIADFLLKEIDSTLSEEQELQALLYLEIANAYLQFHRTQKADEVLQELCIRQRVVLNVEGLLGVRTKFQQKPLPQLCLKVEQTEQNTLPPADSTNGGSVLPKLLLLDDDTRLERIRFVELQDNEVMTLPSVLQALVLAKVKLLKRSQPKDRLADEELEPYIQTLLYQEHGPLQVRQSALLLNCVQESTQRRTVERSCKQCEEAVKVLNGTTYTLQQRLSYGFASFLQPKWQVQQQLCEVLLSLGMTKSALDIYLQIKSWAQVIDCYTRLELRHKAAEIIRQELEKKPTALLHCLLGDAIDDPSCYETAWNFSNHTSGKAQAHWGNYYFHRQKYAEAVPHLEKSVEINSLQEKIWLRLGYCAIMLERWELAVHAYITYTHLEPLGFESWNNLAKALIKLGDKKRAHKVLAESLKCNYTNWKVWENFMIVSVDTGNFEDAMNAYNRLSDLKERFLDLEVLCITMQAIADGKPDAKGQTQERLLKKATTLLGHQCVKHGNEPKLWELAALIANTPLNKAQKLVKAYRAHTSKETAWATKQPLALKALQISRDLCEQSLAAVNDHAEDESEALITSQLNSARLSAQSCVRVIEKDSENWEENQAVLADVKQLLERLTELVKQRMASS